MELNDRQRALMSAFVKEDLKQKKKEAQKLKSASRGRRKR